MTLLDFNGEDGTAPQQRFPRAAQDLVLRPLGIELHGGEVGNAEAIQPARTWFTHLCHDVAHAEVEPTLPNGVRVAFDGLKLEL